MIFRQFDGLFPMPLWFIPGIPQSWAWTLLAPYISSCPANTTRLAWQNFPSLTIINNPNAAKINPNIGPVDNTTGSDNLRTAGIGSNNLCADNNSQGDDCGPAITQNKSIPLSYPGRPIQLSWGQINETVGPNNSYVTSRSSLADAPRYALFVSQLNATFVPLQNISGNTGMVIQPNVSTFANDPAVNGTSFIAITSQNPFVTPFNLSLINP